MRRLTPVLLIVVALIASGCGSDTKAAFAGNDPQAIIKAQTELVSAVTRVSTQINQTIEAINKKLRE